MTHEQNVPELVSGLMARARTDGERRAIAALADAGFFDDSAFRRKALHPRVEGVSWRRVREMWVLLDVTDPSRRTLEESDRMASLAEARPPESLEELQVRIDLDGVDGIVLAAWRDAYAADSGDPNPFHHHIDLCLDELRRRFECWNCGRAASDMSRDDLPVCSTCKETYR